MQNRSMDIGPKSGPTSFFQNKSAVLNKREQAYEEKLKRRELYNKELFGVDPTENAQNYNPFYDNSYKSNLSTSQLLPESDSLVQQRNEAKPERVKIEEPNQRNEKKDQMIQTDERFFPEEKQNLEIGRKQEKQKVVYKPFFDEQTDHRIFQKIKEDYKSFVRNEGKSDFEEKIPTSVPARYNLHKGGMEPQQNAERNNEQSFLEDPGKKYKKNTHSLDTEFQRKKSEQKAYADQLTQMIKEKSQKKYIEKEKNNLISVKLLRESLENSPFGKAGGGAPNRDSYGNLLLKKGIYVNDNLKLYKENGSSQPNYQVNDQSLERNQNDSYEEFQRINNPNSSLNNISRGYDQMDGNGNGNYGNGNQQFQTKNNNVNGLYVDEYMDSNPQYNQANTNSSNIKFTPANNQYGTNQYNQVGSQFNQNKNQYDNYNPANNQLQYNKQYNNQGNNQYNQGNNQYNQGNNQYNQDNNQWSNQYNQGTNQNMNQGTNQYNQSNNGQYNQRIMQSQNNNPFLQATPQLIQNNQYQQNQSYQDQNKGMQYQPQKTPMVPKVLDMKKIEKEFLQQTEYKRTYKHGQNEEIDLQALVNSNFLAFHEYDKKEQMRKYQEHIQLQKTLYDQIEEKRRKKEEMKQAELMKQQLEEDRLKRQRDEIMEKYNKDMEKKMQELQNIKESKPIIKQKEVSVSIKEIPRLPPENKDDGSEKFMEEIKRKEEEKILEIQRQKAIYEGKLEDVNSHLVNLRNQLFSQQNMLNEELNRLKAEALIANEQRFRSQKELENLREELKRQELVEDLRRTELTQALLKTKPMRNFSDNSNIIYPKFAKDFNKAYRFHQINNEYINDSLDNLVQRTNFIPIVDYNKPIKSDNVVFKNKEDDFEYTNPLTMATKVQTLPSSLVKGYSNNDFNAMDVLRNNEDRLEELKRLDKTDGIDMQSKLDNLISDFNKNN